MEAKILFKRFMLIYASQETLTDISTTATTDGFSKKTLLKSEPVLGQVSRDDCLLIQSVVSHIRNNQTIFCQQCQYRYNLKQWQLYSELFLLLAS